MKKAFTLAEVLITLGIIGVVAALILSVLIQKSQNAVILTALKKSYSELENVKLQIENDYGIDFYTIVQNNSNNGLKNILMKYYKNSTSCDDGKCFFNNGIEYYSYNGSKVSTINSRFYNYYFGGTSMFLTKDGRLISLGGSNENGRTITIDVNGPFKKPNIWGHDTFTFKPTQTKIVPCGGKNYCVSNDLCKRTNKNAYNGVNCTYDALNNKNFFNR